MRVFFFRLGFFVAGNPLKTILASVALTCLLLIGMLRFRTESRAENLWVPQGTVALDNKDYVEANYGQAGRLSTIAFVAQEGEGLVNKAALLKMVDVAEDGWKVRADPIDEEGADNTVITFPERCLTTTDANGNELCRISSPLGLFYEADRAVVEDGFVNFHETVRRGINALSEAEIKARLETPPAFYLDGSPFNANEFIGGQSGSGASFDVRIMTYTQFIENNIIVENGERIDKEARALEEAWTIRLLEDTPLLGQPRTIDWFAESLWSQGDSLSQALTGDLPLLAGGFLLLGIYVVLFLGDFHSVRSHMWLGLGALLTTGIALGACFGISSALGMFFGPVHQILPLLIIGIGIDDCFHITRAADEVNLRPDSDSKPVRNRIALALSSSGSAITVTSFTNVVVFLLSAISSLPALRFFALWAVFGVFFAWFFSITFFTALVTLDARRQNSKRRDCCPCMKVDEVKPLNWFKKPPNGFSRFFGNQFGPFITHRIVRVVLLILFIGWFAACCYGTSQLFLKFDFSFFYPDGSAQQEFQDQIDEYFELGEPTRIYVRNRDLSTAENQRRLLNLCKPDGVIAKDQWIQGGTVDCWYVQFRQSLNIEDESQVVPPAEFVDRLKEFLSPDTRGARYANDTIFDGDDKIVGCRFSAQYVFRETNDDEITALTSVRRAADSVGFGLEGENPAAFPYGFSDTFTEQYDALPGEIGVSLGLASVAVAVVCFVLIGHPLVAVVCLLVVGIVIIDVLGLTNFSGINLNSVSVITLVLCAGISVDFVVHIARSFLEHVGTRRERAIKALETMGPPVFYAGFSTLLGIIVLSLARSYIFRVIFQGFLFVILMGFIHGLILGPIILALIGPPSFYLDEEDKQSQERKLEALASHTEEKAVDVETSLEEGAGQESDDV